MNAPQKLGTNLVTLALALACLTLSGCATPFGKNINEAASERWDLGDGMIFDVVPVSLGSKAADAYAPGSGRIIDAVESKLVAQREAKRGPFDGLPYTTQRQVVLKAELAAKLGRAVLSESEIENIIEVLTPIVPGPITRVIEPKNFGTRPATNAPTIVVIPTPSTQLDIDIEDERPAITNATPESMVEELGK